MKPAQSLWEVVVERRLKTEGRSVSRWSGEVKRGLMSALGATFELFLH
jgi:hypothetical protein